MHPPNLRVILLDKTRRHNRRRSGVREMERQFAGSIVNAGLAIALVLACAVNVEAQTTSPPAAPAEPVKVPKTTDQIPPSSEPSPAITAPAAPPPGAASQPPSSGAAPEAPEPTPPEQPSAETPENSEAADEPNLGEVPDFKAVELTDATARGAIDAYLLLKDKYKDAKLEDYESFQDFVDKDAQGKAFEADVKAAGFATVDLWNQTITTVSATYANLNDDQTDDLKQQIEEVQKDTELAQDMKDKIINSLKALIPSPNNNAIVEALQKDAAYSEKLQQLETEEE